MRRGALLLAFAALLPVAAARETPGGDARPERSRRLAAIDRGLAWLASVQRRDGSIGSADSGIVGVTALATLAFFARGYQDGRGPYGDVIRRGVDFLLAQSVVSSRGKFPAGYIHFEGDPDSRMHGHGYATQVLVLAYGCGSSADERTARLKEGVAKAVKVIQESQSLTGGWYYEPSRQSGHEGSVTVTVVQALRMARDAGFVVDRTTIDLGLKYLRKSQKDDGSFKYSLHQDSSTAALTAAAITAMHGFGEYYSDSIDRGLRYLRDEYNDPDDLEWPHYANYYAAQAFYRAGGADWEDWEDRIVPRILAAQTTARAGLGCWEDPSYGRLKVSYGPQLATAFNCLTLSVPDGYLPLFQR